MFARRALTIGALGLMLPGAPAVAQTGDVPVGRIPAEERVALVSLFTSTNGQRWSSSNGWTDENGSLKPWGTECEWEGVDCDDDDGHVVEIRLQERNLSGRLPASVNSLKHLTALDLSGNQLFGPIPAGLLALPRLKRLDLTGNALSGPVAIGGQSCRLEALNLASNHLSGAIPASLATCGRLQHLDLSGNALSFSVPSQIGSLRALQTLFLGNNALEGPIPSSWRGLAALEAVNLANNRLTGSLDVLGSIESLAAIDVSYNRFDGTLNRIASLANLRSFAASNNRLTGSIPLALERLPLQTMDLSRNALTGPLPRSLESLKNLRVLDVASNRLSGPLLQFGRMQSLTRLVLAANEFDGNVSALEFPESLEYLDLSRNRLHGVLPSAFFAGDLRRVSIADNSLEGALPASLWESGTLEVLNASHNRFSGSLPAEIEDLSELRELNLSRNGLSGSIPAALLSLPALVAIDLSENQLSGELPPAGGRALQRLELSANKITGTIPAWIASLPALRFVGLRANSFTSGLDTLAESRTLRAASLDVNPWETPIPPKLASLKTVLDPRFPLLDPRLLTPPPPPPPEKPPTGELQTTIVGRARDETGAAIPGATVTVTSTSGTRSTTTDGSGHFTIPVQPGTYQLTADLQGFQVLSREVTASIERAAKVDLTFNVGGARDVITVESQPSERARGPWWNSWITQRGAPESAVRPKLRPNADYTFYLELSALQRALSGGGVSSASVDPAFLERLRDLATDDEEDVSGPVVNDRYLEPRLTFRFLVIGRAARLLASRENVAVWQDGQWETGKESMAATVTVQLGALLAEDTTGSMNLSETAARAGALRFGIHTGVAGCAAVAVSVWDEAGRVPMDSTVYYLEVGAATCDRSSAMKRASINLLKTPEDRYVQADVALHSFEFTLNGGTTAASFMVLRTPMRDCESYSWSSNATVSGLVLNNTAFKAVLQEARLPEGPSYASVAEQLQTAVFPPSDKRCESTAAWSALQKIAQTEHVRVFARFSDQNGQLQVVPIGLLAMSEEDGTALFPNDFTVIEPLARESLDETPCVSAWTFVLPTELDGLGPVSIPAWAASDERVLRSKAAFQQRFLSASDTSDPLGLLLLAHHEQGVLTFSRVGDTLSFPQLTRRIGDGSIAVLSACKTASLEDNGQFITQLNEKGVDALVTSPFVINPTFGAVFAANFATVIYELEQETAVEQLFRDALSRTAKELEHSHGQRARGMMLELVLAGNPRLKVCPRP